MKRNLYLIATALILTVGSYAWLHAESIDSPVGSGGSSGSFVFSPSSVAVLGTTCSAAHKGQAFIVSDATVGLEGATCAGSGSAVQLAVCNGTNWKCLMGGT